MATRLENGTRTGWLFNYHATTTTVDEDGREEESSGGGGGNSTGNNNNNSSSPSGGNSSSNNKGTGGGGASSKADENNGGGTAFAAMELLFLDHEGDVFFVHYRYNPYFLVAAVEGHEREVEMGLMSTFGAPLIQDVIQTEKEDLDLINHLSGKKRSYLKVVFANVQDLTTVRTRLDTAVKRNAGINNNNNPQISELMSSINGAGSAIGGVDMGATTSFASYRGAGGIYADEGEGRFSDPFVSGATAGDNALAATSWMDWVSDIREHDIKYHVRVAIDEKIYVGVWYDITVEQGVVSIEHCDDSKYAPAMPKVCAFDIETTKAPLKFPQPEVDQIYMISYMLDTRGYLITNREIVAEDIDPFEFTPKPEYEGIFETFNEPDEYNLLRRFFDEMKKHQPNVYVTFNGDYFDFPFIHARALFHGMSMQKEIGFTQNAEGAFLNRKIPHLDCFYWVKRDSYLPQGSQGLKAVTKYKLGYDPIEVDPEDMLPLAQNDPQRMASYSVSDAVSTWYLYLKYVHPFIFSLCTIIPMPPDEVLRKGSGGLCESLLMVQAYAKNVVFPNKQVQEREKFHEGHLIDSETYIGGRVEALKSGVYRSNLPIQFSMNPDMYQQLIDDIDSALAFSIEVENGLQLSDITNYEEVKDNIVSKLAALRDHPSQMADPMIYHLDVGAMYPNIILTNRLQPYAIKQPDVCAGCCFNSPDNVNRCQREMNWIWRGEMFTAGRSEFQRIKAQLENEAFAAATIQKADMAAVQKKTYGNRKGNVLEGTVYERKNDGFGQRNGGNRGNGGGGGGNNGGGGGYRKMNRTQQLEEEKSRVDWKMKNSRGGGDADNDNDDDDDDDTDGKKAYHKLQDNTKYNLLKKRIGEYSRKAYGKTHDCREIMRTNVVCQREDSFYVDTVRLFRDRRYEYKAALKHWKGKLENASDADEIKVCKSRCVQMESLQLAHKCILNSFYGYVMRKGSRWGSMEMAGIVTYLGATLIQMARSLVQQIGVTLELDTDGIWCCLPNTFPENFTFKTSLPKKSAVKVSYPCIVLNKMVNDRYTNHQYQDLTGPGQYNIRKECSIYFEVDGPYLAMFLPASREEGKSIKKRYAVFHPDGKLAELKGFELKRRGELMLVKDFQAQVFRRFLDGHTLEEAYGSAAVVANAALDMLYTRGDGYETSEVLEKLTESSNMTRRLAEYPETQKSLALTTARRIAEVLGPQMVKDKGLACHFVISRLPLGRPVTERAIPITVFRTEPVTRAYFLRKWTGDNSLPADLDLAELLDWNYYTERFNACVQKIISIPAALQLLPNPVPRVKHPDWLHKRMQQLNSKFRQTRLDSIFSAAAATKQIENRMTSKGTVVERDMEDLVHKQSPLQAVAERQQRAESRAKRGGKERTGRPREVDSDYDVDNSDTESVDHILGPNGEAEDDDELNHDAERKHELQLRELRLKYFTPKSTRELDADFFADSAAPDWLARQRQGWIHRAQLRRQVLGSVASATGLAEVAESSGTGNNGAGSRSHGANLAVASGVGSTLSSHFINTKSKALATRWNILEIRPDPRNSQQLTVFAVLEKSLFSFTVNVPRTVYVDTSPEHDKDNDLLTILPAGKATLKVGNRILPRHRTYEQLYEVTLPAGQAGETLLDELQFRRGDVHHVYETNILPIARLIEHAGCCVMVDAELHLKNTKARPLSQRDQFSIEELEAVNTASYLANDQAKQSMFIFHVSSESRGLIALFHRHTNTITVVFIQPSTATRQRIDWAALQQEAVDSLGLERVSDSPPNIVEDYAVDAAAAWKRVTRALNEALEMPRPPLFTVLHSSLTTSHVLENRLIPSSLPIMRVMGAVDDERLLAEPFRWQRSLSRRFMQRCFASLLWVDERLAISRLANIPMCNIAQDSCSHALDVMFTRALHRHMHVMWDSHVPEVAFESVEERPRQVVFPRGLHTWSVEFSISHIDVVATLFSQAIQETDDPRLHALCDRGVRTHFNVLREVLSDLMGSAVSKKEAAMSLLVNVARWLRDPVSNCYEPRIIELVSHLVHRLLTALLLRVAKLGGQTVRTDSNSIIISVPKHTLGDAISFATFLVNSLRDQPMLNHLSLQPTRYWFPLIVLDMRNWAGAYLPADLALTRYSNSSEDPPFEILQFFSTFSLCNSLPPHVRTIFTSRIRMALSLVCKAKVTALEEVAADESVTLATRSEKQTQAIVKHLARLIDEVLHSALIDEVYGIAENREPPSGAEAKSAAFNASPHDTALAYTKAVTHVLELLPDASNVVSAARNNCLRMLGIGPFAPEARFQPRLVDYVQQLPVRCGFCNDDVVLDLSQDTPEKMRCSTCNAPFSPAAVEAHLVRRVSTLVLSYSQQDFACVRCHQVTASLLCMNCCGDLKGSFRYPIHAELRALKLTAAVQNFQWLAECVDAALLIA